MPDLRLKEYGKWKVKDLPPVSKKKTKGWSYSWYCTCECGTEKLVKQENLIYLKSQSCGRCREIGPDNRSWKGHGLISGHFWSNIQLHARLRKIAFHLTIEQAWSLFELQEGKCPYTGLRLVMPLGKRDVPSTEGRKRRWINEPTASLDRKDSKLHYVLENVQWVHKVVNLMKLDMTNDEFLSWIKLVSSYKLGIK